MISVKVNRSITKNDRKRILSHASLRDFERMCRIEELPAGFQGIDIIFWLRCCPEKQIMKEYVIVSNYNTGLIKYL